MNIARRAFEFLLASLLVLAGVYVATQPRAVDAIEAGRRASRVGVVIPRVFADGGQGTGIPLGDGVILTAWHVINTSENVTVSALLRKESMPARVLWRSRDSDLALLYSPMFSSAGVPVRCTDGQIGEPILSLGWPAVGGFQETRGFITGATVRPFILRTVPIHIYRGGVQWTSAILGHGMSGGPTLDGQGRLIGVNVLGVDDFYGIVPASEICRLLGRVQ